MPATAAEHRLDGPSRSGQRRDGAQSAQRSIDRAWRSMGRGGSAGWLDRKKAAQRCLNGVRARSADLDQDAAHVPAPLHNAQEGAVWCGPPAAAAELSPRRVRVLAPMQKQPAHPRARLDLCREEQGYVEMRAKSELMSELEKFGEGGAKRHGLVVEQELSRIKEQLSPQKGSRAAPLPAIGTRAVLTGLTSGSDYNGRQAEVVEHDGCDRVLVHVCGASELCQLSVKAENMVVLEDPSHVSVDAGRDFSRIHELATLHAQETVKREVDRLEAEADTRRRLAEHAVRADYLTNANHSVVGVESIGLSNRQWCRYGNKCAKGDCMDLHPWEAELTQKNGDSKSKLKATKGVYDLLAPATKARSKASARHRGKANTTMNEKCAISPLRGNDLQMAEAAAEIDRILAKSGVPVAARQAAHQNVIPLLCSTHESHGAVGGQDRDMAAAWQLHDSLDVANPCRGSKQANHKIGKGRLGGMSRTGMNKRKNSLHQHSQTCVQRPSSLHELRTLQRSALQTLNGEHCEDDMPTSLRTEKVLESSSQGNATTTGPGDWYFEGEHAEKRIQSWRDTEDPACRKTRIKNLVEIKKAEVRKRKLVEENLMLQEALTACGDVLAEPSTSSPRGMCLGSPPESTVCTGTMSDCPDSNLTDDTKQSALQARVSERKLGARPRVMFSEDADIVFEKGD